MAEHTQPLLKAEGPEYFHGRDAYSVTVWDESGEYYRGTIAELPCTEPTGKNENGKPIFGTQEAYATLFAAAPDLLMACKNLLGVQEQGGYVKGVMQIADAVDKAEGKNPDEGEDPRVLGCDPGA